MWINWDPLFGTVLREDVLVWLGAVAILSSALILVVVMTRPFKGKGKGKMKEGERADWAEEHLKSCALYAMREEQRRGQVTKEEVDLWAQKMGLLKLEADHRKRRSLKDISLSLKRA